MVEGRAPARPARPAIRFARLLFVVVAAFVAVPSDAAAQDAQETDAPVAAPEFDAAPVTLDGVELFLVRGSPSRPAEDRAAEIEADLERAAAAHLDRPPQVVTRKTEFGPAIFVDDIYVTTITSGDEEFEGFDAEHVAEAFVKIIDKEVRAYRDDRSESALGRSVVQAGFWTAAYVAFVAGLLGLRAWLRRRAEHRVERSLTRLAEQTGKVVDSRALVLSMRLFIGGLMTIAIALASYAYVGLVLREFALTKGFAAMLLDTLAGPLIDLGRQALAQIPDLITLVIIILVTRYLLRLARLFFQNVDDGVVTIRDFDRAWVWPTHRIVRFVVIIAAVVVAYPYIPGSGSQAFQGMTILLGVVVSIGSNSVTSNLLAGLVVVYKKSLHVGDRIQVGELIGTVEEVSLLDTHVRSLKNELISIPNTSLLGSAITNFSRTDPDGGLLIHATVGIGYDEPQKVVERLLIGAANDTPGLAASPPPFVLRTALGAHDVTYEINATRDSATDPVRILSDLHARILDRFNAAGVQIMTPFYVADPEAPKIAPATPDAPLRAT